MSFRAMLAGGHPNSLGRTGEVVSLVLADGDRLPELFDAIHDPDAVVRMRVGDAIEKVCRERPEWFVPLVGRIFDELGVIEQPSVQWHVAQLFDHLRDSLSDADAARAVGLLQANLHGSPDWIVRNVTMDVLTRWSRSDAALRAWLVPVLTRLQDDPRASVSRRAGKRLSEVRALD